MVASAPHIVGAFPPAPFGDKDFVGQATMNPLVYTPVIRAVFRALDAWVADGMAPPPSRYPHHRRRHAGGPQAPPAGRPSPACRTAHGADDDVSAGLRPRVGQGHRHRWSRRARRRRSSAGCRRWTRPATTAPASACRRSRCRWPRTPAGTTGCRRSAHPIAWPARSVRICHYRAPSADRERTGDGRRSIAERYPSREDYLGRHRPRNVDAGRGALPAARGRAGGACPRRPALGLGHWDRAG